MSKYTKAQLSAMNSNIILGSNWIKNIENIKENEEAILYSTGDAGLSSGRIYIALPASTILTIAIIKQYNIWL